jgi:DNA-binding XRE family transcriptional regulator
MSRLKTGSHLADGEVGTYALVAIGQRLTRIRGQTTQAVFAPEVGLHKNTLGTYERGEREIGGLSVAAYVAKGWNANWILTGEGPEQLEAAFQSHSQDLSESNLNIALEYTDDIIRATRATYVPRSLYAKLLRLMYQGVTQGLPVADIHEIGQQLVRAVISGNGEQGNGSQSGLDGPGQGGS